MPDYAWTDGVAPSAATINANVREQVVTTCTSATRPTNVDGRIIAETNTDRVLHGNGTVWRILSEPVQAWTPTITQSGSVTFTNTASGFWRTRELCHFFGKFTITGTGTGANNIVLTLPVTAAASSELVSGNAFLFDSSAVLNYPGLIYAVSTTTMLFPSTTAGTANGLGSTSFTAALANNDVLYVSGWYRRNISATD